MSNPRFVIDRDLQLHTERLIIKRASPWRLPKEYFSALNDPTIMQFTESRFQNWNRRTGSDFVRRANNGRSSVLFSVWHASDEVWIGNVRLFNWSINHRSVELSFLFFARGYWGQGLAHEAIREIIDFSSRRFGIRRFYADHYARNLASARVFRKLGFRVEGTSVGQFIFEGEAVDSVRVGYLCNE